ncbi:MAG: glycosyltransferase [Candidatus Dormibacteraceae bacterium]
MRIAVIASPVTPLRPEQVGGAQAVVTDLAIGLAGRGHEVRLHCTEGSIVPGVELVMVPAPPDAAAALVMPAGAPPPVAPGVAAALALMFRSIGSSGVDAISQHAFDAPAFELSAGLPVLHTLHLPPVVPAVTEAVARVATTRLATVSESCRASWAGALVEVGLVLRNGIRDVGVDDGPVEAAALIAGRMSPEKGVEHAITASRIAGLRVKVAGAAYDPHYHVDLAGTELLGALARPDLRRMMSHCAVTVCAVRWDEPFGMVAAESQMAGCPVAGYRRGALPEVVEEGISGFLAEPDDLEALAAAIRRCLTLDRDAVRASALRRLGIEPMLDRYEAALGAAAR